MISGPRRPDVPIVAIPTCLPCSCRISAIWGIFCWRVLMCCWGLRSTVAAVVKKVLLLTHSRDIHQNRDIKKQTESFFFRSFPLRSRLRLSSLILSTRGSKLRVAGLLIALGAAAESFFVREEDRILRRHLQIYLIDRSN